MSTSKPLYTVRQFRLFISGSRQATPAMRHTAYKAVERAKANGWAVLVGDAEGVDAAVIEACNALQVNYVCFGISAKPRNRRVVLVSDGGTGRYCRIEVAKPYDYATRDRRVAELADRALCIWNSRSKGTAALADYMKHLNKPVDILTVAKKAAAKTQAAKPVTVEVLIDTTTSGEAFEGTIGLRALDGSGAVLRQTRQVISELTASTLDYAKLTTIIQALERLQAHLNGKQAAYSLRIVQSSANVDGWLARGWKRNATRVQQLTAAADHLLKQFPQIEWVKCKRPEVNAVLATI